jgi:DNA-binding transcriptional regulator YhcF (GntR family)
MDLLFDKIISLKQITTLSKHEQLIQGIVECIDEEILVVGNQLPSINQMVDKIGYARKTIVKAYEELKDRGLVESKKIKGYFIISNKTEVVLKVALVLYSFHRFQEEFYNTFRKQLGKRFQIDIFIHHNNLAVFENILSNIYAKYGMYVVAPIENSVTRPILETIDPRKLLIIDRCLLLGNEYSYVSQEFEETTYSKLSEVITEIRKYEKTVLFYRDDSDYPVGVFDGFNRFLSDNSVDGSVEREYKIGSLKKGTLYFFINDTDLWTFLKDCKQNEFVIGKDVGVLSHNDNIIKEIFSDGIATISTDFIEMARKAAEFVKFGEKIQEIIPSYLVKRNSL